MTTNTFVRTCRLLLDEGWEACKLPSNEILLRPPAGWRPVGRNNEYCDNPITAVARRKFIRKGDRAAARAMEGDMDLDTAIDLLKIEESKQRPLIVGSMECEIHAYEEEAEKVFLRIRLLKAFRLKPDRIPPGFWDEPDNSRIKPQYLKLCNAYAAQIIARAGRGRRRRPEHKKKRT